MKKAIFALLAAGCLAASACGSKGSSSGESSSSVEKVDLKPAETEGSFTTEDGLFDYSGPKGAEVVPGGENGSGTYENAFLTAPDLCVGVASYRGMRQTAKGFGEPIKDDLADAGFTEVKGEAIELGGVPTYMITAIAGANQLDDPTFHEAAAGEMDYVVYLMQYGCGDFFALTAAAPKGNLSGYQPQIDAVLGSVVFKGEPLPTETVTAENDYFKMEVPPNLSVRRNDADSISVDYTICDGMDDFICNGTIMAEPDQTDVQSAADAKLTVWRYGSSSSQNLKKESSTFLGREAVRLSRDLVMTKDTYHHDLYVFEVNGKVYSYNEVSTPGMTEKFSEDMKPVLDSLTFKK